MSNQSSVWKGLAAVFAAIGLAAMVLPGCGDDGSSSRSECIRDGDCPPNWVCIEGVCVD